MVKTVLNNGWIIYHENFLQESSLLFERLITEIPWKSGQIKLFGKTYPIPRMQSFHSVKHLNYTYSGLRMNSEKWHPILAQINSQIKKEYQFSFNACLVNLYRNGMDSNGWHADNEHELGKNPLIASVSLGVERTFKLKHIYSNEQIKLSLNDGSLLIMGGEIQHFWKHEVPKQVKITDSRINLTFRNIIK